MHVELREGLFYFPEFLKIDAQEKLVREIRMVVAAAPLFTPYMPKTGIPMSVQMTNCGQSGWVSDKQQGYRYQAIHPVTGKSWPEIPEMLIHVWDKVSGYEKRPQACLINYYKPGAKMGMHQDRDERSFDVPVLSISLGDTCLFRYGGENRTDRTRSLRLKSGDVLLLSGASRLVFHGVDRIYPGTCALLKQNGRINLTLRRVIS